jgi:ergot alkaloid biosynthesis protein
MSGLTLVTGSTGKTGAHLVEKLVEGGWPVRAANRSGTAGAGTEGVVFDWNEATGHAAALEGVDRVFLLAPTGSSAPLEVMAPFIELALARGVRRFVLLSSSQLDEGGPAMGAVHALLHRRAPEWAVLQPSWFMENFTVDPHLASIRSEDAIYSATDDGLVPFLSVEDIAAVALRTLTDAHPANAGLVLTGPRLLTYDDVAATIGEARHRPVRHLRLTAHELAARHERFGIPAGFAALLAGLDRAIASGREARTTPVVAQMLGREALSFEAFAGTRGALW